MMVVYVAIGLTRGAPATDELSSCRRMTIPIGVATKFIRALGGLVR